MAEYPVVFTIRDVVSGNGFLAGVSISGRALIVHEDGAWWTLGVRPAAISAMEESPVGSYACFSRTFRSYLIDTASSAPDFEAFKTEVERFFYERDEAEEQRWHEAGRAIARGEVTIEPPFDGLKRESRPRPLGISIERLDTAQVFTPADNLLDSFALAPAA